jgi:signal transduction histidine kinase
MGPKWIRLLDDWLSKAPSWIAFLCAVGLTLAIGFVDLTTRPSFMVLYIIPLFGASWYAGKYPGYVISLLACTLAYWDHKIHTSIPGMDVQAMLDQSVRLFVYLVLSATFAKLRSLRLQQEQMMSYIVHDLRSPISNTISGLLTLEQITTNLSAHETEMIQLALVSSQRALRLVNSMLDVAKIQNGRMEIQPQTVVLKPFLEECLSQTALWAKGNEITVTVDTEVETAVFDLDVTARIVLNLLSNALRFSPRGSAIVVSAKIESSGLKVSVQDSGPGIPSDQQASIFEPYAQLKGTKGGTGLGLTFCMLAVHAQKGNIGVESKVGSGSKFWFTLPQTNLVNA